MLSKYKNNSDQSSQFTGHKSKKIYKFGIKRKATKVVHSLCLVYTKPDGTKDSIIHQKITQTIVQDSNTMRKYCQKSAKAFSQKWIFKYYQKLQPYKTENINQQENLTSFYFFQQLLEQNILNQQRVIGFRLT